MNSFYSTKEGGVLESNFCHFTVKRTRKTTSTPVLEFMSQNKRMTNLTCFLKNEKLVIANCNNFWLKRIPIFKVLFCKVIVFRALTQIGQIFCYDLSLMNSQSFDHSAFFRGLESFPATDRLNKSRGNCLGMFALLTHNLEAEVGSF